MDFKDILTELQIDGESSEAISFETIIKMIDEQDPDSKEMFDEMPVIVKLMKSVHKQGFWQGAEFGRMLFMKIVENEEKIRVIEESELDQKLNEQEYKDGKLGDMDKP
jgi:hypothetical protein